MTSFHWSDLNLRSKILFLFLISLTRDINFTSWSKKLRISLKVGACTLGHRIWTVPWPPLKRVSHLLSSFATTRGVIISNIDNHNSVYWLWFFNTTTDIPWPGVFSLFFSNWKTVSVTKPLSLISLIQVKVFTAATCYRRNRGTWTFWTLDSLFFANTCSLSALFHLVLILWP